MTALTTLVTALAAVLTLFARAPVAGTSSPPVAPAARPLTDREQVLAVAAGPVGTTAKTGNNDGEVVKYLTSVGLAKGDPYCAAFVYWCGQQSLGKANPFPRSGYSPDMVRQPGWIKGRGPTPEPGDTFGIYFSSKGRVAHTGFVAGLKGNSIATIEANTSPQPAAGEADRNGDGVWRKIRPLSTIHSVKRWLP